MGYKYNYNLDQTFLKSGSYHCFIEINDRDFILITNKLLQEKEKYVDEIDPKVLSKIREKEFDRIAKEDAVKKNFTREQHKQDQAFFNFTSLASC